MLFGFARDDKGSVVDQPVREGTAAAKFLDELGFVCREVRPEHFDSSGRAANDDVIVTVDEKRQPTLVSPPKQFGGGHIMTSATASSPPSVETGTSVTAGTLSVS